MSGPHFRRFRRSPPGKTLICAAFFALAASQAAASSASTELGHPLVRNFTPRDYQGHPLCQAAVQGANGVMYFANNVGLLSYDGATWRPIGLTDGSDAVRQLARGADGTIWVGGGAVMGSLREKDGTAEFVSLWADRPAAERPKFDVFQVLPVGGSVYFVTEQAVLIWRDRRLVTVPCPTPAGSRGPRLHAIGERLYVSAPGAPLRRLADDRLATAADAPFFRDHAIVAVEAAPAGGDALLLLTAEHGWFGLDAGRVTPWATPMNASLAGKRVRRFLRRDDGSSAVSFATVSGNGGLLFGPDGRLLARLDESIGLLNRAVRDFCCDREGGLWLGLESGIARVEWPSLFTVFDGINGLGLGFVTSVTRHEGVLYAGTLEGVYRLTPGDGVAHAAHFEQVFNQAAYSVLSHPAGLLAYGYTDLFIATPGGFQTLFTTPATMGVLRTSRTEPARVWFTTSRGLRSIWHGAEGWRDEGVLPGTEQSDNTLGLAADGALWLIETGRGIMRVTLEGERGAARGTPRIEKFPSGTAGVPDFRGSHATNWGGEPVFSFNTSPKVFRFDAARREFSAVPGTAALPGANLEVGWSSSDSVEETNATLWLANSAAPTASRSLFAVPRGGGPIRTMPHVIADSAGRIWRMKVEDGADGGTLWLCSANGLIRVDSRAAVPRPAPYAATLWSARVRSGEILPAQREAIDFEFAAPRFHTGTALEFSTRLGGFDAGWSPWSPDRKRSFTHLPAGDYRFEVRARDSDGVVSAPAARAFSVLPEWWLTWWFLGFSGVAATGAVAGATRAIATRALKRRVALLEAQTAVERERLRLARDLHDEVGSGLGRVILFAGEARRVRDDPAQLDAALDRVRATAQDLVQHAREIVWAVSPQHDTLASLFEHLGDYTVDTLRAAGIACRLDAPAAAGLPAAMIGSEMRHSLFLAVKEAVHNCVKYSGARDAALTLRLDGGFIEVILQDHGRGFFAGERQGSGNGLRNLTLRAEALGGAGSVTSEPGRGTTVTLRVPLQRSPGQHPPAASP
jgi:signal transduction histidine kinase